MIPENIKLIVDLTIGDGWIGFRGAGRKNPFYICEHCEAQADYAIFKENLLKESGYTTTGKFYISKNPKCFGKTYYRFYTWEHEDFYTAFKYVYNKGRKAIDEHLLRTLDWRSIAFWFMDDGNAKKIYYNLGKYEKWVYEQPKINCYRLSVARYNDSEVDKLAEWFTSRGINVTKSKHKLGFWDIGIYQESSKDKFRDLIKPYIVPCLEYKILGSHSFRGIPFKVEPRVYAAVETERNDPTNGG